MCVCVLAEYWFKYDLHCWPMNWKIITIPKKVIKIEKF